VNQRKPATDETTAQRPGEGLIPAIRELTDGITDLVRYQFQLLRLEAKREATDAGKNGGLLAAYGGVALIGYTLVLVGLILGGGWLWGTGGAALVAFGLGAAHLLIGGVQSMRRINDFQDQKRRIEQKSQNLTGNGDLPWLEEKAES